MGFGTQPCPECGGDGTIECFECDGNNIVELLDVFSKMKVQNSKPKLLIAKTKMGSGVKSIEDDYKWHGKAPNNQETEEFINQLS